MTIRMRLRVDARSPIPIRWQLSEQLKHVIEAGGVPRDQALPSIRELAGFLGINPNTVARAIEDLKRSGYVEARRGKGVFVASASPPRSSLTHREAFLKDTVIRAAAQGMTPDDVAVGVLSLASDGVAAALRGTAEVLLDRVQRAGARLLWTGAPGSPAGPCRQSAPQGLDDHRAAAGAAWSLGRRGHELRPPPGGGAHLDGRGVPVLALLAEARLETLQRLARASVRHSGSAWSPRPWRPPIPWSTRSPPPPSRTSRGSRPARPRSVRSVGWCDV